MRILLTITITLFALSVSAQESVKEQGIQSHTRSKFVFGYLSYDSVFHTMPGYSEAIAQLEAIKESFIEETRRAENEFNDKYEEFLEGQKDFPPAILQKRQNELQEFLDKNIAFKVESKRLLKEAEEELFSPLKERLNEAINVVGEHEGYAFIINIDNNGCPFISTSQGVDVTSAVLQQLK